jgi:hypothetical protein
MTQSAQARHPNNFSSKQYSYSTKARHTNDYSSLSLAHNLLKKAAIDRNREMVVQE